MTVWQQEVRRRLVSVRGVLLAVQHTKQRVGTTKLSNAVLLQQDLLPRTFCTTTLAQHHQRNLLALCHVGTCWLLLVGSRHTAQNTA